MSEQPPNSVAIPPGTVCCTTYGQIRHETALALMEMRSFSERQGMLNVHWETLPATLVEKARNEAVRGMLRRGSHWLCFVDGDMVFQPDALIRLLHTAYVDLPHADAVGAWCPLRGDLAIPTIDSGTGTWESWFPGSGVVEVIRTGAAFVLFKRHTFEALQDPWFRMRVPMRPLDFLLELDGFTRQKFDGRNPMRGLPGEPWERLEKCARDDPSVAPGTFVPVEVGEDSSWSDRMKNAGFRIFVNTDVACGHIDTRILTHADHKRAIEERERAQRLLCGVGA